MKHTISGTVLITAPTDGVAPTQRVYTEQRRYLGSVRKMRSCWQFSCGPGAGEWFDVPTKTAALTEIVRYARRYGRLADEQEQPR